ncbi:MAG: hypothetical protein IPH35_00810 [Rhodoferax sp.]|nr:hypothetical protein [Rhodoferax sp.]
MPISLRLPADLETQIAGFGERLGISKSAVIVRSIQEFLANHAQPGSSQIYEEVMQGMQDAPESVSADAVRESAEQRAHKLRARAAIRRKHQERSQPGALAPGNPDKPL